MLSQPRSIGNQHLSAFKFGIAESLWPWPARQYFWKDLSIRGHVDLLLLGIPWMFTDKSNDYFLASSPNRNMTTSWQLQNSSFH